MKPFIFEKQEPIFTELTALETEEVVGGVPDGTVENFPGGSTGTWYSVEGGRGIRTDD